MTQLSALLGTISDAVEALDKYLADVPADVSTDDLVMALKQASGSEGLKTALSGALTTLEQAVADNLPGDSWTVERAGMVVNVERKWAHGSTKWDTKECWSAVVSAATDQGYDPLLVLGDAAAVSYFRVKQLKQLGVNPDSYRTQEGGRWRIVIE